MRKPVTHASSIRAKLVSLLCLATLAGSWTHVLAHGHSVFHSDEVATERALAHAAPSGEAEGPAQARAHSAAASDERVSADDAHHEHASRAAIEAEACLACRSGGHDDANRSAGASLAIAPADDDRLPALRTDSRQRLTGRVHSPRAPPALRFPIA